MTLQEQLAAWQAKRASAVASMTEIMEKAAQEGTNLDDEQQEQFDEHEADVAAIDKHIKRVETMIKLDAKSAKPVSGKGGDDAAATRQGQTISVKSNLPKGTAFTRYAMALAKSKGNTMQAAEFAKRWDDTPEVHTVLKAAVAAGTTTDPTWASPLVEYQNMEGEFIALLRPQTIIGNIQGLRRVPFNVKLPGQTGGSTVNWVGEGKAKPVSALSFKSMQLGMHKAAGIVVITEELARSSSPSAESIVRQDLIAGIAQFLDTAFIDPSKAENADTNPASITNGISGIAASGKDLTALQVDIKKVFKTFIDANLSPRDGVWVMSPTSALSISMMTNALGQPAFPQMTMNGGTFFGMPVVVSELAKQNIVLVNASDILLADDGQVVLDASSEASVEMSDDPDGSTSLVSLWQNNMLGIRAERFINWKRRREEAVSMITGAAYGETP